MYMQIVQNTQTGKVYRFQNLMECWQQSSPGSCWPG